jgi:hypothetical protein
METIELRYLTEMEKNSLTKADLPKDAQTGITQINQILKAIKMLDSQGKTVSQKVLDKLAMLDKWTTFEILDHVNDTKKNTDEKPVEAKEVIEEIKEEAKEDKEDADDKDEKEEKPAAKTMGDFINDELHKMHESGQSDFTIDEVKDKARNSYNAIFENYKEGEENGVETTYYSLMESGEKTYTLKQL